MRELLLACLLTASAFAQPAKFGSFTNSDDVGAPPLKGSAEFDPATGQYKIAGSGSDADYITIRTSDMTGISGEGERLKPAVHARAMPKIVAPDDKAAVSTEPRAHHYKFIGIESSTMMTW